MTLDQESLRAEAAKLLFILQELPFQDGYPLSRDCRDLPNRAGLYAFRHREFGILYIGKAVSIRARIRGGHKALGWAFIDRYSPDDVRVVVAPLSFIWARLSLELERWVLQQVRPPYNDRIAQED